MITTEFLLYLVIVIFAVYFILNYYKEDNVKTRYVPVQQVRYVTPDSANGSENNQSQQYQDSQYSQNSQNSQNSQYGQRYGQKYNQRVNVNVNNGNGLLPDGMGAPFSPYGAANPPAPIGSYPPNGPPIGPNGPAPFPPIDPLRKFDYDAVGDDFTPPFRRSYYDDYNYILNPALYPAYTRGPPGRFRKIGTLIAQGVATNDKYKFMNLMGREKYVGREYEYYAISTDTENKVKFYIDTRGKEIHDCDIVTIPELDGYIFKFKEDPDLSPRYDPYLV
ncbi:MAG: hypothetical protein Dasosvirus16_3 [Dasosvirus sp.]|uniref:Uncharacterized protein n=1 Tax=Dasosvirus sp. TaxID=2487764 RepID=A0A3G4ZRT8_9VIRU|nr:MAG: hypothetical protein Dasosvirus16_3 [Dasosvirus sp.]